jgi:hypothetical protein
LDGGYIGPARRVQNISIVSNFAQHGSAGPYSINPDLSVVGMQPSGRTLGHTPQPRSPRPGVHPLFQFRCGISAGERAALRSQPAPHVTALTIAACIGVLVLATNIGALAVGWWRPQTYKNIFQVAPPRERRRTGG